MNVSAMCLYNCNQFILHAIKGVEGSGIYLTAIKRYWCSYPMISSVLDNSLLLAKEILPADFLRLLIAGLVLFPARFANWLLSLSVGRTMTKICRLIGSGSLSRATNSSFMAGCHGK